MKQLVSAVIAALMIMTIISGCSNTEPQAEVTPPADTDCYAVADEAALEFQSLFLNYLQYDVTRRSILWDKGYEKGIDQNGWFFLPVVDDEIKCCNDIKEIFLEYCTEEYTDYLLEKYGIYKDFDGKLYCAETGLCPPVGYYACYIDECRLEGNEIIADFIVLGSENEFSLNEVETTDDFYKIDFTMTLIWQNGKWLISDFYDADYDYHGDGSEIGYYYVSSAA